ncbi:hypothetical protein AA12717_1374 [Gluconacetobacter sacchari DSM 12717]|uniref:Uncharacterized protein n=2 Tax=Gluconacetobacter sacchari TaxID=92759 RepID=A0A7W4IBB4_9PROT|nr:hypothetical protein [Gluconacetobacter sacchari]MBB2159695.1 hypothetical protein [Gluconacetobacter sacchari]GBQ23049.1 hypothetical protein AA12717_1374 [Gluconacetobacter sacchari DSM 12717]
MTFAEEIELLVDIVLGDPPTDNADILAGATALERDADEMEEACPADAKVARVQARRLRDFVATRQARMDGTPDPLLH